MAANKTRLILHMIGRLVRDGNQPPEIAAGMVFVEGIAVALRYPAWAAAFWDQLPDDTQNATGRVAKSVVEIIPMDKSPST